MALKTTNRILEMKTAESLQAAHYGIGGHYGPHQDIHDRADKGRDRIATLLV